MLDHTHSANPDRAPLTHGRVDLVFRDGDELVVVDYKIDKDVTKKTAEQYARKHHGGQSEVYQRGLSSATGLPVREVAFVYWAGAEVRLPGGEVIAVASGDRGVAQQQPIRVVVERTAAASVAVAPRSPCCS